MDIHVIVFCFWRLHGLQYWSLPTSTVYQPDKYAEWTKWRACLKAFPAVGFVCSVCFGWINESSMFPGNYHEWTLCGKLHLWMQLGSADSIQNMICINLNLITIGCSHNKILLPWTTRKPSVLDGFSEKTVENPWKIMENPGKNMEKPTILLGACRVMHTHRASKLPGLGNGQARDRRCRRVIPGRHPGSFFGGWLSLMVEIWIFLGGWDVNKVLSLMVENGEWFRMAWLIKMVDNNDV